MLTRGVALLDQPEAGAAAALLDGHLALGERAVRHPVGKPLQLLAAHAREDRHIGQGVDSIGHRADHMPGAR